MSQDEVTRVWTTIKDLIDQICTFQTIEPALYMNVHSAVFDYLTDKSLRSAESRKIPDRVRRFWIPGNILGGDVYHHIKFCLQDKLESIVQGAKDLLDEDVLRLYENHWDRYEDMCKLLNGSCAYVNRHWVRREYDAGRRDVDEIFLLSRQIWERVFFKPLISRVTDSCYSVIKSHRNRQTIDVQVLKNIIQILVSRDFNETMVKMIDSNSTSVHFSKENFESTILRDTEKFYRDQKTSYETKPIITYLNEVARCIDEEVERFQSYLTESTKSLLINTAKEILIHDCQHIIDHEIKPLLDNDRYEELTDLFKLISRIPNTKNKLTEAIESYIQHMGSNAIERVHTTAIKDAKVYIDTILEVYIKCLALAKKTFNDDPALTAAFNKACQSFINNNSVTASVGNSSKSSELLAQYCDILLRKSGKTMDGIEFEEECNQIMFVFNFIDDKDIYEKLYGKMLTKRLINQSSVSDDYEKLMVTKLKQCCGTAYTSKLERIICDIDTSQTINKEYQTDCQNRQQKLSVDFSVMILASNSWTLSLSSNIVLPNELNLLFDNFIRFYTQNQYWKKKSELHIGRKLTRLDQYSKGELQIYFNQQKYTLKVSMYQMVILLLFNKSLKWTIEQIETETQIKRDLLIQILNALIKSNLLVCTQLNNEGLKENDLHMNCIIELATDYKNQKTRINLNLPIKAIKQKDVTNLQTTINDELKMIIQATIVRIMKGYKILKHSLLMQEVIEQVNSRFKPDVSMIKKCIEHLIEKEYLQRQSNEKDVLEYLP